MDALVSLPVVRQRLVLRAWLRQLGLPVPSERTLAALRHDMLEAACDRVPRVNWPGACVHRYRGHLHACGQAEESAAIAGGPWPVGADFDLGVLGRLVLTPATGAGLKREGLPPVLRVDSRTGGEFFRPAGSAHRRPLRKWLQERGVLPWRREQLPLIRIGDEIVAIGDIAYGGTRVAGPGEPSWQVAWEGRPVLTENEAITPSEVAGRGPFR
jgi:tRNA(Ile)-lysidine synthase